MREIRSKGPFRRSKGLLASEAAMVEASRSLERSGKPERSAIRIVAGCGGLMN